MAASRKSNFEGLKEDRKSIDDLHQSIKTSIEEWREWAGCDSEEIDEDNTSPGKSGASIT